MDQFNEVDGSQQVGNQLDASGAVKGKRNYNTPRLLEYGSFTKLTQGGGLPGGDMTPASPACL